jgi:hypothetical protein
MASLLNSLSAIFFYIGLADRIWSIKTYEKTVVTMSNTQVLKKEKKGGTSVSLFTPGVRKAFTENIYIWAPLILMEIGFVNVTLTEMGLNHVQ